MSRARHKKGKAAGGPVVAGGNPEVIKEARTFRKGGKVCAMEGGKSKRRLDKPGRKMGGRVGANTSPLSTAHSATKAEAAS